MFYTKDKIKLEEKPFSDNTMEYDLEEHQYVLTTSYVKKKLSTDLSTRLGSEDKALAFLQNVSDTFYTICYATCNVNYRQQNIKTKEYLLAKDHTMREGIKKTLLAMVQSEIQSGALSTAYEHGRDFKTMLVMPKHTEYDDLVPAVKRLFELHELSYSGTYQFCVDPEDYRRDY